MSVVRVFCTMFVLLVVCALMRGTAGSAHEKEPLHPYTGIRSLNAYSGDILEENTTFRALVRFESFSTVLVANELSSEHHCPNAQRGNSRVLLKLSSHVASLVWELRFRGVVGRKVLS